MQFWKSLMAKKEKQTSEEQERIVKLKEKDTKNFGNSSELPPFKKEVPNVTNRKIHVDMEAPTVAIELVTKRKRNVSLHSTKSPYQEEESKSATKTGQKSRKTSLPLVYQPETRKSPIFIKEEASMIIQKQIERRRMQQKLRGRKNNSNL
jgi:hypothetical protein